MNADHTTLLRTDPARAGRARLRRDGRPRRPGLRPVRGAAHARVQDPRIVEADDASLEGRIAAGGPLVVLAEAADERIGGWLLDGCAVLPPEASGAQVDAALVALEAGLVAVPPSFAAAALRYERIGEAPARPARGVLTPRERDVLAGMSEGGSNRDIATSLGISPHTAKFHVAQIIAKLGAKSRAQAVAKAIRAGLLDAG